MFKLCPFNKVSVVEFNVVLQIFEIINNKVVPWVVLSDGNGHNEKGFKIEWATIKDKVLYVGSMGKEWTTAGGDFESFDPMWIKAVNMHGEVILNFLTFIS